MRQRARVGENGRSGRSETRRSFEEGIDRPLKGTCEQVRQGAEQNENHPGQRYCGESLPGRKPNLGLGEATAEESDDGAGET